MKGPRGAGKVGANKEGVNTRIGQADSGTKQGRKGTGGANK
jgi:hypothetical protein